MTANIEYKTCLTKWTKASSWKQPNYKSKRKHEKHPSWYRVSHLTVSLPNKMSTYGMTFIRGSLKNWLMNGADRFMQKILLFSEACLATFRIDSGDTVRKKPCEQETGSVDAGLEGSDTEHSSGRIMFVDTGWPARVFALNQHPWKLEVDQDLWTWTLNETFQRHLVWRDRITEVT